MTTTPFDRIHLELTNRCNFRCEFCPQGVQARPPAAMDFGLLGRLLDEIGEHQLASSVTYHVLGEPLLYRELPKALVYTRRAGIRPVLVTNGSLFHPQLTQAVAAARPHTVGISLQTPEQDSFALRGAQGLSYTNYRRSVLAGVRGLLAGDGQVRVSLYLLTTPLKWVLYPATRGLTILDDSWTLRRTVAAWTRALDRALGNAHPLRSRGEIARDLSRLKVWRQNRINLSDRLSIETRVVGDWGRRARQPDAGTPRFPAYLGSCHGLREHLAVLADGQFAYCCTDHEGRTSVHNANRMSIREFLEQPEVQRDREGFEHWRLRNPACRACLGGPTRLHRAIRQFGSIFYHGVYRKWFQDPVAYRDD